MGKRRDGQSPWLGIDLFVHALRRYYRPQSLQFLFNLRHFRIWASQVVLVVKNLPANAGDSRDLGSTPGLIPWKREWLPAPEFLPGKLHGQRSQVGYSVWGFKGSDITEQLNPYTEFEETEEKIVRKLRMCVLAWRELGHWLRNPLQPWSCCLGWAVCQGRGPQG